MVHRRHHVYVDIVPGGIPFLRQTPSWHAVAGLAGSLESFQIEVLDVVDVVVSKLKRFNASNRSDIAAMLEAGAVPHASLIECFREAVEFYGMDARASGLPRYVKRLHFVERDMLGVAPTAIELPSWIDNE